ncbi:MAG: matrixin family metalloprotease [Myxococcales bacterium]|nr:MAG: matrixin family metalloprotease [Myxococcales bacterium]
MGSAKRTDGSQFDSAAPANIDEEGFRNAITTSQQKWEAPGCTNFEFQRPVPKVSDIATNLSDDFFPDSRCGDRFGIPTNAADCINRMVFRTTTDEQDVMSWPQSSTDERWASNSGNGANGENPNPQQVLALTTTIFNATTGRIIDADMDINAANFSWTLEDIDFPEYDTENNRTVAELQGVMTHELGHVLGFGHMDTETSSIMYPSRFEEIDELNEKNDVNAVCTTYPIDSITPGSGDLILAGIDGGCMLLQGGQDSRSSVVWLFAVFAFMILRPNRKKL